MNQQHAFSIYTDTYVYLKMTPAEEAAASAARLAEVSAALQLAICDQDCQDAAAMTNLIIILSIVGICLLFCLLNMWLVWKGKMPFCCCCSCSMGGLFPLKSRLAHYNKKKEVEETEEEDTEAKLISKSEYPFSHVKMCLAPVRDC